MKNEHGMTLIELLAAIVIFSMIVGVLYSLFSFAQASWVHTEGSAQTETQVQELKTVLTRELASPTNLMKNSVELRFETQEETFSILKLQDEKLHLYQSKESYSKAPLLYQFTLPVNHIELLDQNKSPLPNGTELTKGYGYIKINYSKGGLKSKDSDLIIPINIFAP